MASTVNFNFNDDGSKQPPNPNAQSPTGQAPGSEDPRIVPKTQGASVQESLKQQTKKQIQAQKEAEKTRQRSGRLEERRLRNEEKAGSDEPDADASEDREKSFDVTKNFDAKGHADRLFRQSISRIQLPFGGTAQRLWNKATPLRDAFQRSASGAFRTPAQGMQPLRPPVRPSVDVDKLAFDLKSVESDPKKYHLGELDRLAGEGVGRGGRLPNRPYPLQPPIQPSRPPVPPASQTVSAITKGGTQEGFSFARLFGMGGGKPPIPGVGAAASGAGGVGRLAGMAGMGGAGLVGLAGPAAAGFGIAFGTAAVAAAALYALERAANASGKALRENLGDVMPQIGLARGIAASQRALLGLQIDRRLGGRLGNLELAEAGRDRFALRRDAAIFEILGPLTEGREAFEYATSFVVTRALENVAVQFNANGGILRSMTGLQELLTGLRIDNQAFAKILRKMLGDQSGKFDEMVTALNMSYTEVLPVPGTFEGGL